MSVYPSTYRGNLALKGVPAAVFRASDFRSASPVPRLAANANMRHVASALRLPVGRRALGFIARGVPLLGLALTLWDLYDLYQLFRSLPGTGYNMNNWTLECLGGGGQDYLCDFPQPCSTGLVYITIANWNAKVGKISQGAPDRAYFYELTYPNKIAGYAHQIKFAAKYARVGADPGGDTIPLNSPKVVPVPNAVPLELPAPLIETIDPASRSPFGLQATPQPVPYPLIPHLRSNPWRYHRYQRESGYVVPLPLRSPQLKPDEFPLVAPTVAVSASPEIAARAEPLPATHTLGKPKSGDKERKIRTKGYLAMNFVLGNITEGLDLLYCVWDALPKKYQQGWKRPKPQLALEILYKNWDKVDVELAGKNIALNQIEDFVYGSIGQEMKKASKKLRPHGDLPIGFQAGPAL